MATGLLMMTFSILFNKHSLIWGHPYHNHQQFSIIIIIITNENADRQQRINNEFCFVSFSIHWHVFIRRVGYLLLRRHGKTRPAIRMHLLFIYLQFTWMFCIISSLSLEIPSHMIKCIHLFPLLFQQFSQPAVIEQLAYILIVIGGIMFFLSFLGYCGAIGESKCMLSLVSSFTCNANVYLMILLYTVIPLDLELPWKPKWLVCEKWGI